MLTSIPYTLPQEELVKLFNQSCLRPIASTLLIQQHKPFKEAIPQVVIIEIFKIKPLNNRYGYTKKKIK